MKSHCTPVKHCTRSLFSQPRRAQSWNSPRIKRLIAISIRKGPGSRCGHKLHVGRMPPDSKPCNGHQSQSMQMMILFVLLLVLALGRRKGLGSTKAFASEGCLMFFRRIIFTFCWRTASQTYLPGGPRGGGAGQRRFREGFTGFTTSFALRVGFGIAIGIAMHAIGIGFGLC